MAIAEHPSANLSPPQPESAAECPHFAVKSFGMSDRGQKRPTNEDCFVVAELTRTLQVHHGNLAQKKASYSCHRGHVLLVADGVGGHTAGEVASGLSVQSVETFLLNTLKKFANLKADDEQCVLRDLQKALFHADARIFEEIDKHPEWAGMATTLTMGFAVNGRLFVAHAGDSRCYLFSGDHLQQITQDHTIAAELVRRGVIEPQAQRKHPYRHVVTNILGGKTPGVTADVHSLELHDGDILLLCSDGLTEMVSDDRIAELIQTADNPQRACERLVNEANLLGGRDNITVIVAQIEQEHS